MGRTAPKTRSNTRTVTIAGRTYTFSPDGAKTGGAVRILGVLRDSHGQFAGPVVERISNGRRWIAGASIRATADAIHEALADLPATPADPTA